MGLLNGLSQAIRIDGRGSFRHPPVVYARFLPGLLLLPQQFALGAMAFDEIVSQAAQREAERQSSLAVPPASSEHVRAHSEAVSLVFCHRSSVVHCRTWQLPV